MSNKNEFYLIGGVLITISYEHSVYRFVLVTSNKNYTWIGTGSDTIVRKHDSLQGQPIKKGSFVLVKTIDRPFISLVRDQPTTDGDKKKNTFTRTMCIQRSRATCISTHGARKLRSKQRTGLRRISRRIARIRCETSRVSLL